MLIFISNAQISRTLLPMTSRFSQSRFTKNQWIPTNENKLRKYWQLIKNWAATFTHTNRLDFSTAIIKTKKIYISQC